MRAHPRRLRYQLQNTPQTLREAMEEYYESNPKLLNPRDFPPAIARLLRRHDTTHVLFGCDTSLHGEVLTNTWFAFGSSTGLRDYADYLRDPHAFKVFAAVGSRRIAKNLLRWLWDIQRIIARTLAMPAKWPLDDFELYLDRPLGELRREFNIRVL